MVEYVMCVIGRFMVYFGCTIDTQIKEVMSMISGDYTEQYAITS